ncbi:unnamed protein product [Moneuplotes crassus]|uniref:Uncharacterized protein n=1 Tax=Euplotes crassus TaxID=5936 RepID=A0AAD2D3W7_EUPCR|nr:unnamed protein product [Moneuplotes crassus]
MKSGFGVISQRYRDKREQILMREIDRRAKKEEEKNSRKRNKKRNKMTQEFLSECFERNQHTTTKNDIMLNIPRHEREGVYTQPGIVIDRGRQEKIKGIREQEQKEREERIKKHDSKAYIHNQKLDLNLLEKTRHHVSEGSAQDLHAKIAKKGIIQVNKMRNKSEIVKKNSKEADQSNSQLHKKPPLATKGHKKAVSFGSHSYFNNNCLIINPKVDASNRQIQLINNFRNDRKILEDMLLMGKKEIKMFKPSQPGIFDFENTISIKKMAQKRQMLIDARKKVFREEFDSFDEDIKKKTPRKISSIPILQPRLNGGSPFCSPEREWISDSEIKPNLGSHLNYIDTSSFLSKYTDPNKTRIELNGHKKANSQLIEPRKPPIDLGNFSDSESNASQENSSSLKKTINKQEKSNSSLEPSKLSKKKAYSTPNSPKKRGKTLLTTTAGNKRHKTFAKIKSLVRNKNQFMTYALHDELQPKPYVYKPSEIRHGETGLEKFSRFGMILNSQEEESHNHNVSKEDSIFSMSDKINPPEKSLNNKLSNFFGENLAEKFRPEKISKIKADKSAKFHKSPDLHPTSPKMSFNPCPNHGSFSTLNPSPSALYFSKTGSKVRPEREKITKERKVREAKYIERDKRMQKLFKE